MSKVIGIDLGTTNSCCSIVDNNDVVIVPNSTGSRTTPSVVAFSKAGERIVGEGAVRQQVTNMNRTISSIKREMGTDWKINIDGKNYNPQFISALILLQLKNDAKDYLGYEVNDAVITVPAYFNDIQRQATKDAGRIAGLNVLRIINEPTSAALAYGLDHEESQKVMVYDLGGGTFDVSIIDINDGVIEVLSTSGDNHLGGDDFDQKVAEWILEQIKREHNIDLRKDAMAYQRVKEASRQAKHELSSIESTQIMLPYIASVHGTPFHFETVLTRAKFDELTKELVQRTTIPVQNALSDAGISTRELSKVLLVGGSTRIPSVQKKVKELTGIEPSKNINPDECVAQGAAILGNTLGGTKNELVTSNPILLLDVTPLSLAIETVGGVATRLIERNTTVPCKYTQTFTTASPMQKRVEINVLQGERPMARDNKSIGKFQMKGIKRSASGMPEIEVTFEIDANGILTVTAHDVTTGQKQEITITADNRMSDAEIERAMDEALNNSGVDTVRVEFIELERDCKNYIYQVRNQLNVKKKEMDKMTRKQAKSDCEALEKYLKKVKLETVTEMDLEQIKTLKQNLELSCGSIF